jgi:tetratricopeptide (TPR) repeat protein
MADKASILKEVQKYLAKGQLDKAIAEWEKLLQFAPDANVYNTIGDLCLKKGDKPRAIDQFHRAADIFRKEGFSLKALAIYKKILNVDPSEARSLFALGELNEEKNIVTDAIKYYLAAGDLFLKANRKEDAVKTYQKILALAPNNLQLKLKIAELFSKEGFVDETSDEYVDIARLHEQGGDRESAGKYLQRALEIKPANRKALIGMAAFHENRGDFERALECVRSAIMRTGKSADLVLQAARLSLAAGKLTDAKEFAGAVLQSDQGSLDARLVLAEALMKEGQAEAAWLEYAPATDELVFRGRGEEAVEILHAFKETEPVEARKKLISFHIQQKDNPQALRELSELAGLYEEKAMRQEALACYREALSISPGDEAIKGKIAELETIGEPEEEKPAPAEEKSVEEALAEADGFIGYGLFDEAKGVLEALKLRAPADTGVHLKLKSVYIDTGDVEQAVTECIILAELYRRAGDEKKREAVIKEAFAINPDDPRLAERFGDQYPVAGKPPAEAPSRPSAEFASGGEYDEELAEAAFYVDQGLYDEAGKIYGKFLAAFPGDESIRAKMAEIEALRETSRAGPQAEAVPAGDAPEDLPGLSVEEVMGSVEAQEPAMDGDVLDIFNEFKKGLERELEEEDTETHYNLGIAYKEMGLLDDAIREFQTAKQDPKFFIHSATLLGVCYTEKGLYPLAVEALQSALMKVGGKDDAYWSLRFDLAGAYEKMGSLKEAFEIYTEIYGRDSKYRNVAEKVNALQPLVKPSREQKAGGQAPDESKPKKSRVSYI